MSMNGMTIKGFRGGNARNGKTTFPNVVARQERAKARQEISSKRTPEEQLKLLDAAGLVATKERAKLAQRIADRQRKAAEDLMKATPKELGEAAVAGAKKPKSPKFQRGHHKVSAEDAEKLRRIPTPLKPMVPVKIEE